MRRFLLGLTVIVCLFYTHLCFALSTNERVWVIGAGMADKSTEQTLYVLNPSGIITATIPGPTTDYPTIYSTSNPDAELWLSINRYTLGSVSESGRFQNFLPSQTGAPFYVYNKNTIYSIYSAGITKTTFRSNRFYDEKFLLQSATIPILDFRTIAVDGTGRVYFGDPGHLYRYNPANQELIKIGNETFPTSLDAFNDVAYFSKQQDGYVYKVEADGTYHIYNSSLSPVHYLAVDNGGNIIVVSGNVPQLSLWQVAPDGTTSLFSSVTFKQVYGLGISHGGK